ncbi:MAG: hypothetical protein KJ770_00760 [Actinobacteria bacterium]|nr:hypothetical protein [Actinomycetota bacterium]MCG2788398.1 hypothetical protein [Actinomycetes bacterium]
MDYSKEIPVSTDRTERICCHAWLAIAYEVRTRIMYSDRDIFIPELRLQV